MATLRAAARQAVCEDSPPIVVTTPAPVTMQDILKTLEDNGIYASLPGRKVPNVRYKGPQELQDQLKANAEQKRRRKAERRLSSKQ